MTDKAKTEPSDRPVEVGDLTIQMAAAGAREVKRCLADQDLMRQENAPAEIAFRVWKSFCEAYKVRS